MSRPTDWSMVAWAIEMDESDANLLGRHVAGDGAAFSELAARHGGLVYNTARRLAPQDADDVTQAVFLLLSQKAAKLRGYGTLAPWLHRTTRYCALNARKMRRRREHHEQVAGAAMPRVESPTLDPALAGELDDALARLPAAERAAVLLRHLEDHSVEQTAAALNVTPGAAAKRALRGLEKLRDFFARRGHTVGAGTIAALLAAELARPAPAAVLVSPPSAFAAALAKSTAQMLLKGTLMKSAALLTASAATAALIAWGATLAGAQHLPAAAPMADASATAPAATGDLVVASYAVLLEEPAADRLRALSAGIPATAGQSAFYELRTAHMAEIRKVLHDAGNNANYAMAYDFPEHPSPTPPPWQGKWGWQEFSMQQFHHDHFSTYISAKLGEPFAQQSPGTAELRENRAHVSVNFDNEQVQQAVYILNSDFSTQTSDVPWLETKGSIHWTGDLTPGDAFLALGTVKQLPGAPLTIVAVCETARVPGEEAQFLKTCQDTSRWLSEGPEGLRREADIALVWGYGNRVSHGDERVIARAWTKTTPGGVKVSLEAVGDSGESAFAWWDPAGNATVSPRYNPIPKGSLALALHVVSPQTDSGDAGAPEAERYDYEQVKELPAGVSRATLYIAGPTWRDEPIAPGETVRLSSGETVTFEKIVPSGDLTLAEISGSVAAPQQVSIAAIKRDGTRVIAANSRQDIERTLFAAGDEVPVWKGDTENVYVKAGEVDHWVLLTRGREAVTFDHFALRPQTDPAAAKLDADELHAMHLIASKEVALQDGQREADRLDDLDALPRNPGTPAGVMRLMVDAADNGNAAGVEKYVTGSNPQAVAAVARGLAAVGGLYCRAEKRFGRVEMAQACEDAGEPLALQESFLGDSWKISANGESASSNGSQRLVRDGKGGGQWKLESDSLYPKLPAAALTARMNALAAGAAALSTDLDSGKIPSPAEAANRMKRLMSDAP